MAVTTVFYSGPADNVEMETSTGSWAGAQVDLGECQDIVITWEPTGPENMQKGRIQTGGIGKIALKGMTTNSTIAGYVEGVATRQDLRITVKAAYYIIKNVLIKVGFSGELNDPNKTTTFDVMGQVWTADLDTFVTLPGA